MFKFLCLQLHVWQLDLFLIVVLSCPDDFFPFLRIEICWPRGILAVITLTCCGLVCLQVWHFSVSWAGDWNELVLGEESFHMLSGSPSGSDFLEKSLLLILCPSGTRNFNHKWVNFLFFSLICVSQASGRSFWASLVCTFFFQRQSRMYGALIFFPTKIHPHIWGI